MSMPTGRISRSGSMIFRVGTEEIVGTGRARQARQRKYRQLIRWLMTRLGRRRSDQRSRTDLRRQLLASSAAVAVALLRIVLLFDTTRPELLDSLPALTGSALGPTPCGPLRD
jgi:hypothetical protein